MDRVSELSSLYKFPMGRCEFCLREVARRARAANVPQVAELAERGAQEASAAMRLAMQVSAAHNGAYSPQAVALDQVVDGCLAAVSGYLDVQMRAYPGEPRALAAERMLRTLMPDGLGAISGLPYTDEHAMINTILAIAEEPKHQADLQLLPELSDLLARLRDKNRAYGAALHPESELPDSADVSTMRARAQDTLTAVAGLIVGLYELRGPAADAERNRLLDPILRQNAALRAYRRRRRAPVDIDPTTGEEAPAEPVIDAAPPPADAMDAEQRVSAKRA